uniref:Putative secreted protein n=1 Tax=Amblyomma triste TaxID=251400 RepID=A0A023G5A4_AMBTT
MHLASAWIWSYSARLSSVGALESNVQHGNLVVTLLLSFLSEMLARAFASRYRRCHLTRCFWTSAEEDANPGPKTEEERRQKTAEYNKIFHDMDESVCFGRLSDNERKIYEAHKLAVQRADKSYIDPVTGFNVFTGLFHYLRGYCCGFGCRHCPYQHINAKDEVKEKMVFNSAFYVPKTTSSTS